MKHAWLVTYSTHNHERAEIVIWSDNKSDVRKILKHHLGDLKFTINRVTEASVNHGGIAWLQGGM